MTRSSDPHESGDAEGHELDELRKLLLGDAPERIDRVEERLDVADVRTEEVAAVLPDAIRQESERGDRLGAALAPTVEEALHVSIRRNPRALAEAVSPIMGPAIRRSILQAISGMVQSLNTAMEQSLTPQGLKWRIEGWRTGRSFGEVVALRTLLFEVEEVFLIHRETSLLLSHRAVRESTDADVVGSMLVAIRDFVRDSFAGGGAGTLDTIQVGEKTVWVENGRDTVLAAVIRGQAPSGLRTTLAETLEEIELRYGHSLEAFDGDDAPFENVSSDHLAECMVAQAKNGEAGEEEKGGTALGTRLVWAVVLVAVLVFFGLRLRDGMRWDRFTALLAAEPGIVLIDEDRGEGRWVASGLRDPLSVRPESLLVGSPLDTSDVSFVFTAYQSLEPEIVLRRAEAVSAPEEGVTLGLEGGVLQVGGAPSAAWLERVRTQLVSLGGIESVELLGEAQEVGELRTLGATLADRFVLFGPGSAFLDPSAEDMDSLRVGLRRADALARSLGRSVSVEVVGSTDPTGAVERNRQLAADRAEAVVAALPASDFPGLSFVVRAEPSVGDETRSSARDRSVRVIVVAPEG